MKRNYCLLLLLSVISVITASDWYIDPIGSEDPNGSIESPFSTIQEALNTAQSGDTVILKPGIYTGPGNYDLNPGGLLLTIRSTDPNDPDVTAVTIIDPNEAGRAFLFTSGETLNFVLAGFTIRNASAALYNPIPFGGAIYCENSGPTIRNCVFTDCFAAGYGGAFSGNSCTARMEHCLFSRNTANYGGAVTLDYSDIEMIHCTIAGNLAHLTGGGLMCDFESTVTLRNSILFFNMLDHLTYSGKQATIRNGSVVSAFYSDISNSEKDLVAISGTLLFMEGNLQTDPNFALYASDLSFSQLDFHLRSPFGRWDPSFGQWVQDTVKSPCIDAGDPNSIWTEEPWPHGKRVNMGFYGSTSQASMNGNPGDFDLNGKVDLDDFSELADLWLSNVFSDIHDLCKDGRIDLLDFERFSQEWLRKNASPADFNSDGKVDVNDLVSFTSRWLHGGYPEPQDLNHDGSINLHDFNVFCHEWSFNNKS